ncbi:MAG: MoaD/ThiS family protein [Deltaproteobacteria bacterium]|nr:MoaD/ThiS family protein [Deltaproteobacteria bacterium]
MRIKVYAPLFGDSEELDENGYLELPENATLGDLYKKMKIPRMLRNSLLCSVNYERSKKKRILKEGDVVSFIGPLSGG